MNGRHRRNAIHQKLNATATEEPLRRLLKRSTGRISRARRHHRGEELALNVHLPQTRHRMRIVKLQPAVKVFI